MIYSLSKENMYNELVTLEDKKLQLVDRIVSSNDSEKSTKEKLENLSIRSLEEWIAKIKGFESSYETTATPISVLALFLTIISVILQSIGLTSAVMIYLLAITTLILLMSIAIMNQAKVVKEAVMVRSILEDILLVKRDNEKGKTEE